jgi:hypothetical protein
MNTSSEGLKYANPKKVIVLDSDWKISLEWGIPTRVSCTEKQWLN